MVTPKWSLDPDNFAFVLFFSSPRLTMNDTTPALYRRTYPYVKAYWTDLSGQWRYTLTSYHGSILTAFLAILLSYALGRLLFISNFILHFCLYRRSENSKPKTV